MKFKFTIENPLEVD